MHPYLTLHHPSSAREYYAQGLWREESLYALLARHASYRPSALAARDGKRELTWHQLFDWVEGVSSALAELGVTAGDRVSIWTDNGLESVILFLACSRDGTACNPSLHRTYHSREIVQLLDRLQSRVLLTRADWGADDSSSVVAATLAKAKSLTEIWTPETVPQHGPAKRDPVGDPDKVVYLAFTSGTTGAPKCVMHSDNTLLANARDLVRDWGHDEQTVLLSLSPFSHHIAWVAVAQGLLAGCKLITDDP
ncbi:MAG: class I adenylate-forming enzyme family protein, partial [Alphaproteobacteria bacterium]